MVPGCSYICKPVLDETCPSACRDVSTSASASILHLECSVASKRNVPFHSCAWILVYSVLKFLRTLIPQHRNVVVNMRQNKSVIKRLSWSIW